MSLSPYLRGEFVRRTLLDVSLFPHLYVSLHYNEPGEEGQYELRGMSYERMEFERTELALGMMANTNTLQTLALPDGPVSHIGLWDSPKHGLFLVGGALLAPFSVRIGQGLSWRPGEIVFNMAEPEPLPRKQG